MFQLQKQFRFEASHQLPYHDGKCARLHGHSWQGWVTVEGEDLVYDGPKQDMLVDYSEIKEILEPIVEEYLDHHHLNETLEMKSPTSEAIARWLYEKLAVEMSIKIPRVRLVSVTILETCTCTCTYRPSPPTTVGEYQ
jgi:6-pyruvoyltetrahydropterin/6-carboxytetrahydropterin synthase